MPNPWLLNRLRNSLGKPFSWFLDRWKTMVSVGWIRQSMAQQSRKEKQWEMVLVFGGCIEEPFPVFHEHLVCVSICQVHSHLQCPRSHYSSQAEQLLVTQEVFPLFCWQEKEVVGKESKLPKFIPGISVRAKFKSSSLRSQSLCRTDAHGHCWLQITNQPVKPDILQFLKYLCSSHSFVFHSLRHMLAKPLQNSFHTIFKSVLCRKVILSMSFFCQIIKHQAEIETIIYSSLVPFSWNLF